MPVWSPASHHHQHRSALILFFLVVLLAALLWAVPAHGGPAWQVAGTAAPISAIVAG